MGPGTLKDLYLDELATLYDAEMQGLRTLPRLSEAAYSAELRNVLMKHCHESRLHIERIELIFTHWGERRPLRSSPGLTGIVQEADERLNQEVTPDARDAAVVAVAQRIEHYEIAAYGAARLCALRLNRWDEARLLQETLEEEGRMDNRLAAAMAEAPIADYVRLASAGIEPAIG
jgi:ferritin-like metal-binding protein YciE